jgi:hypothetical protein
MQDAVYPQNKLSTCGVTLDFPLAVMALILPQWIHDPPGAAKIRVEVRDAPPVIRAVRKHSSMAAK